MDAQLLYKMIKSKTEYPLHKAIKVEREDVVFLYLIEMDAQVKSQHWILEMIMQNWSVYYLFLQHTELDLVAFTTIIHVSSSTNKLGYCMAKS